MGKKIVSLFEKQEQGGKKCLQARRYELEDHQWNKIKNLLQENRGL